VEAEEAGKQDGSGLVKARMCAPMALVGCGMAQWARGGPVAGWIASWCEMRQGNTKWCVALIFIKFLAYHQKYYGRINKNPLRPTADPAWKGTLQG
jgi:hypothetical protein